MSEDSRIGSQIAHYRVTAKLGQGGMGEVWRAEDTRLGRQVALKMLPEVFAADPERLARFEREARVLASLSHPNIAGIHGIEEVDGQRFLVMEVAEGETLAERLSRGALPVEEAARVALQIAEAVEAAHERGVVHRDLKPANVKIDPEGRVKVLDFGLAKALAPDPVSGDGIDQDLSLSPTLTQAMTGAGVLLGTAGYMSPEQARGKPVDRRADIWAFGCVLYEMLVGRRLYRGETATDVVAAIVHGEPRLEELPGATPGRLRRLLERCLQKDPTRRLQSIGDARIVLQEWLEHPDEPESVVAVAAPGRRWLPWAVGIGGIALGLLLGATLLGRGEEPEPVRRFATRLSEQPLFVDRGAAFALSPDGRQLAYVTRSGGLGLWLRPLDRLEAIQVAFNQDFSGAPYQPFFSPDGRWLGFVTDETLEKVPVGGGTSITLAPVTRPRGASWGPDGTIVFSPGGRTGLSLVPAAGGEVRPLTEVDPDGAFESHRWPQWLPDGEAVLFTALTGDTGNAIEVVEVATGERRVLHPGGAYGRYVPTGHVLFVDESALFALPFDADRRRVTGSPMPVLEGIQSEQDDGEAQYEVSADGTLIFKPGSDTLDTFTIGWADREGRIEPLWDDPGFYGSPSLSPDGKRLVVSVLRDNWDVWVYDLERQTPTRLTFEPGYDADPVWSPDGRWIAYVSEREDGLGLYRKRSDGAGAAELLIAAGGPIGFPAPTSSAPDGSLLICSPDESGGGPQDLWILPPGGGEPEPFLATAADERDGDFSPDGRWIAYRSDEIGRPEVFVRPRTGEGKWQVSDGLGFQPRFSPSGNELFYRAPEGLMAVEIEADGEDFRFRRPQILFGEVFGGAAGVTVPGYLFYDYWVAPGGERFVVLPRRVTGESDLATVHVVTGWFGELRALTESVGQ